MVIIYSIIVATIFILTIGTIIYFLSSLYKVESFADKAEKASGLVPFNQQTEQQFRPEGIMAFKTFSEIAAPLISSVGQFKNLDFYSYRFDGNASYVGDGGGDMYDGGNWTRIYIDGQISNNLTYSQTVASVFTANNNKRVEHVGMGYTPGAPLAYLCKCSQRARIGFQKAGNLGADGWGTQINNIVCDREFLDGYEVYAWRRQVYNAGDPSICDLFFAIADNSSVVHSRQMFARVGGSTDDGYSEFYMDCTNVLMGCILLSRPHGIAVPVSDCKEVLRKICGVLKRRFNILDLKGSIEDSFKCKDCMISLLTRKGVNINNASKQIEDMLKVRPDEYLALMGQNLEGLPDDIRAKLPGMELNEVVSQMRKQIMINEEGAKIALDTCMIPLSFIQRMINDSPNQVKLDNNTDMDFKTLTLGNMTLKTNIKRSLTNDISQLMKIDSIVEYRQEELGALLDVGDKSYIRTVMIQLFALSDSVTMRTINSLLNRYRTTHNERRVAKQHEDTSIVQLTDATRDNNVAQAKAASSEKILNEQVPKTQTARNKENHEINRNYNALGSQDWKLRQNYYYAPGTSAWR